MIKSTAILLIGVSLASLSIAAQRSPLDKFIADREFCAYMAGLPENDSKEFLERYQTAMRGAVSFIRKNNQKMTENEALFSIKAKCDEALNSMLHYK